MQRIFLSILCIAVFVVAAGACFIFWKPLSLQVFLLVVNVKDPERDAALYIAGGNIRCYSINGIATYFPAVANRDAEKICWEHEYNLRGTSDFLLDDWHESLNMKAISYASKYNAYVESALRRNHDGMK